ncbi:MAG: TonB-dependent receptor [Gemmatimonadota bacterium]|nr:TonB-dependent receptor [Gemmatimonadota bacterium]
MAGSAVRTAWAVLPALLLSLLLPRAGAAQEGALAGTVTDASRGIGLSTVEVEVLDGERVVAAALSGGGGAYRITGVPAGTWEVRFTLAGWSVERVPGVTIRSGETTSLNAVLSERSFNLNPITVTTSKRVEKALDAPAAVEVVTTEDVRERPTITISDHVKEKAGVDVITAGLQQSYTVVRGFNNIFSGQTLTLTDNRIARVPSLRANVTHLQPTTNLDIDRVEVVLGPGSALYGPNAANGVIHYITNSPIDRPGISLSVAGGIRQQDGFETAVNLPVSGPTAIPTDGSDEEVWQTEGRIAYKVSDEFGVKLSGQYFTGEDYRFTDREEAIQRDLATACTALGFDATQAPCLNFTGDLPRTPLGGLTAESQQQLETRVANVAGGRDLDLERWALDLRADWRPTEDWDIVLSGGRTMAENSVDLTGIGAGQVQDWALWYGQARASYKDLFGQVFFNKSDNDETFLLRAGRPLVDKSSLFVAQLQHQYSVADGHDLIYGLDYLRTVPKSEGTINGRHEDDDEVDEFGGYVQYDGHLTDQWNLVLAARLDDHSRLDDLVFSPRAAIVFKPTPERSIRASYNRAFSTPTTLNLFLDISAQPIPLPGTPFRYDVRAQGPTEDGFTFARDGAGFPTHLSPFAPLIGQSPRTPLSTQTPDVFSLATEIVRASNPQAGGLLDAAQNPALGGAPTNEQIPVIGLLLDPETGGFDPATAASVREIADVPNLDATIWQTFEVGYKGLLFGSNLLLGANLYFTDVSDFISALRPFTPNSFLPFQQTEAFLRERFTALVGVAFPDAATAEATATQLATQMSQIPLGSVAPTTAGGLTDAPILLTYRNLGDFDYFGGDASLTYVLNDRWEATGTVSYVEEDRFDAGSETVALNAPRWKGSLGLTYREPQSGFNAGVRGRYVDAFPVESGVFEGDVEEYAVFDVNVGYRIPGNREISVQLDISNVLDDEYQSFPGTPSLGRFSLLRVLWATDF